METPHPNKKYLCHQGLYGPILSRQHRARLEPIRPKTTIPKLHHYCRRFRRRSLVESTKDPTITLPEITKHGHEKDCGGLQNYPYSSTRSRTRTTSGRPT